jgi:hypothetical protein
MNNESIRFGMACCGLYSGCNTVWLVKMLVEVVGIPTLCMCGGRSSGATH